MDEDHVETYLDFVREMIARTKDPVTREWLEKKLQEALVEQANGRDFEAEAKAIREHSAWKPT